jgi:hypothetical protein
MKYELRDDSNQETIEARDLADARRQAGAWARAGDWNEPEETIWIRVTIFDEDGDWVDTVHVAIDPTEPACSGYEEHDWRAPHALVGGLKENPGVHGHGGGIVIAEVCVRCGCKRTTDTWAQDRSTGEQGLTSVSYERKAYSADEIARAS